jgi:hypothetical protein
MFVVLIKAITSGRKVVIENCFFKKGNEALRQRGEIENRNWEFGIGNWWLEIFCVIRH